MSPGRRTNRKNLRSCQRTILLYSSYYSRQRKIRACKYTYFQSSAARPQVDDRIWCRPAEPLSQNPSQTRRFACCIDPNRCAIPIAICSCFVKIRHFPRSARDYKQRVMWGQPSSAVRHRPSCARRTAEDGCPHMNRTCLFSRPLSLRRPGACRTHPSRLTRMNSSPRPSPFRRW